jgi:hypothetical protein
LVTTCRKYPLLPILCFHILGRNAGRENGVFLLEHICPRLADRGSANDKWANQKTFPCDIYNDQLIEYPSLYSRVLLYNRQPQLVFPVGIVATRVFRWTSIDGLARLRTPSIVVAREKMNVGSTVITVNILQPQLTHPHRQEPGHRYDALLPTCPVCVCFLPSHTQKSYTYRRYAHCRRRIR